MGVVCFSDKTPLPQGHTLRLTGWVRKRKGVCAVFWAWEHGYDVIGCPQRAAIGPQKKPSRGWDPRLTGALLLTSTEESSNSGPKGTKKAMEPWQAGKMVSQTTGLWAEPAGHWPPVCLTPLSCTPRLSLLCGPGSWSNRSGSKRSSVLPAHLPPGEFILWLPPWGTWDRQWGQQRALGGPF